MRRSGSRGPARSRRSRAPRASSIAPSTRTLRRRPCACANGWRRESGCSSTMRKAARRLRSRPLRRSRDAILSEARSRIAERRRGKHVSGSSFRKQMVDRVRRDAVDDGGSRAGHSLHAGPLHQTVESGISAGIVPAFPPPAVLPQSRPRSLFPFVGSLIDRWGVRTVLLPIVVLCASSVALIALTPNSIVVFMLLFAITGVLGIGPRAARLREVRFCLVRRQARPGAWE